MKISILPGLLTIVLTACFDSSSHNVTSIVDNNIDHELLVVYHKATFLSGPYLPDTLQPWEVKELMNDAGSGPSQPYPFYYGARCDSITVVFDNIRKTTHYNKYVTGTSGIPFNSPRNILNPVNWIRDLKKNSRRRYNSNYTYTFTEQDYLDAQ